MTGFKDSGCRIGVRHDVEKAGALRCISCFRFFKMTGVGEKRRQRSLLSGVCDLKPCKSPFLPFPTGVAWEFGELTLKPRWEQQSAGINYGCRALPHPGSCG